ncbi:MAG: methylmalonyl-CoA mutase family protein [Pseudomonadota bacterium]
MLDQQWRGLVDKALKGEPLATLNSATEEGITLEPLYAAGDAPSLTCRGGATRWTVAQRVDHPNAEMAYTQTMAELEGGASGLCLVARGAPASFGYGIDLDHLPTILGDVLVDAIRLTLEPSPARARSARALAHYLSERSELNRLITVDFGLDAPSMLAATGGLRGTAETTRERQAVHFAELKDHGFGGTIYRADGRVIHNAGGTDALELGFVLASLVFAMKSGSNPQEAAEGTMLGVALDADQFAGIAKQRALRILHTKLIEMAGLEAFKPHIHAETSRRMLTRLDSHVNMLRTTTAVFAAAVGGADAITSLPFTWPHGLPEAFARRNARNTQLVLQEESRLFQVNDPAAGSGLFESYTRALCDKAWSAFQAIEAEGGVIEALTSGHIQKAVRRAREECAEALRSGERHLTGTTMFQLADEYPVEVDELSPTEERLKDGLATYAEPLSFAPLDLDALGTAEIGTGSGDGH